MEFLFHHVPTEIRGTGHVQEVVFKTPAGEKVISAGLVISAIGYEAAFNNVSGSEIVAIGVGASRNAQNIGFITAVGYRTLADNTGEASTAVGYSALRRISGVSNWRNTAVGTNSSAFILTGDENTSIGYRSYYSNGTSGSGGSANTIIGATSGFNLTTGSFNTFIGHSSGYNATTSTGSVFLGYQAGYNETGNNKLYIANNSSSALIQGDFSTKAVNITGSLTVGNITGTSTIGRIDASNDVVAFSTSDIRFKENVKPIENALEKINQIGGYTFDWKTDEELVSLHGFKGHDIGVIAQEIESILPEVVTTRDNGYKAVKYEKIVPLLIQAIKELKEEVDSLKANNYNKLN
jgi:hypothetical protein